jgi:hypothetical protein
MSHASRRQFMAKVGRGMIVASVGYATAVDMELSPAFAADAGSEKHDDRLTFGNRERLVSLIQETGPEKILAKAVELLRGGTAIGDLVAAAALANARTFGGEDYIGFHTMMALAPAYHMTKEMPRDRQALPVLKVLHRNSRRTAETHGDHHDTLAPVAPRSLTSSDRNADVLREAIHRRDLAAAEQTLAASAKQSPATAWNDLLETVCESADVHRVVLAHRAWDMRELAGEEHAASLLRESLRYCVKNEEAALKYMPGPRTMLPKLFDQFKLAGRTPGTREVDDAWVEKTSLAIFGATPDAAAEIVAAALAEGIKPTAVSEAVSLATNQLVLRDRGRPAAQVQPNKPEGSVHGDSIGVHACDSSHAWRHIALASNPRNSTAALILSAYQAAFDRTSRGGDFLTWQPRPLAEQLEKITATDAGELAKQLDGAIREKDQERAAAIVHRYGLQNHNPRGVLDVLIRYATSEDGALHAEKFYRTTTDEFALARPAFRWRQIVALARVTASEYGQPAPGYEEAQHLLGLT